MNNKIVAAPPVAEEKLVVRDALGNLREYNLPAVRESMEKLFGMDPATPDGDVIRFMVMCQVTGANLFLKEAQILPFKLKGKMTGAEYLTVKYWDRISAGHSDFAGLREWPIDEDEKAVPVTTRDPERVRGAICEVLRHSWEIPLRVVVSVDDVMKRYPAKQGQKEGDPIGDFWANPHKRINMLLKCARHKALSRALGPEEYQEQDFADVEPEPTEADTEIEQPTEADAEADEVIEAEFQEVEQPAESPAPVEEPPPVEDPPATVVDKETGEITDVPVIGEGRAAEFKQHMVKHFSGTKEQKKQLEDGLKAWLIDHGAAALNDLYEDLLPDLYAWAKEAADIPLPDEPAFDGPPAETDGAVEKLDADGTDRLIADIRKLGEILGYDDDLINEMIEARADDPDRLRELKQKFSAAEANDG